MILQRNAYMYGGKSRDATPTRLPTYIIVHRLILWRFD